MSITSLILSQYNQKLGKHEKLATSPSDDMWWTDAGGDQHNAFATSATRTHRVQLLKIFSALPSSTHIDIIFLCRTWGRGEVEGAETWQGSWFWRLLAQSTQGCSSFSGSAPLSDLWPRQRCPKTLGLRTFALSPKRVSSKIRGTTEPSAWLLSQEKSLSPSSRTGWSIYWIQTISLIRAKTGFVKVGLVLQTSLTFTNMCSVSVTGRGPWM